MTAKLFQPSKFPRLTDFTQRCLNEAIVAVRLLVWVDGHSRTDPAAYGFGERLLV
jgi:hypothetical protein